MKERAIAVYCASSNNISEIYRQAAFELGEEIARHGATLVNGGGKMGLMGAGIDGALAAGGKAIGVIPDFMVRNGWHHTGMTEMIVTDGMHSRKSTIASMCDGAIAMPGGIGTFDELFEIITWRQLGLYTGNVVIYNVENYFAPMLSLLAQAQQQGFMRDNHTPLFTVASSAKEAVQQALAQPQELDFTPMF